MAGTYLLLRFVGVALILVMFGIFVAMYQAAVKLIARCRCGRQMAHGRREVHGRQHRNA